MRNIFYSILLYFQYQNFKYHSMLIKLSLYFELFAYTKLYIYICSLRAIKMKETKLLFFIIVYLFSRVDNISQPLETRLRCVNVNQYFYVHSRQTTSK